MGHMHQEFKHISVMPQEVITYLKPEGGKTYVDGTLGGGGHAKLILDMIYPKGMLIGIDQDIEAIEHIKKYLKKYENNLIIVNDNFRKLSNILDNLNITGVDGILLDLGVSTHQLLGADRGFSFALGCENLKQPLDMRMSKKNKNTAADILNEYKESELVNLFYKLGEEKYSKFIVKEIIKKRPITTIGDLIMSIKSGTPPHYREGKPPAKWASNVFRALRMEVNDELGAVDEVLKQSLKYLNPGGKLVVITFHSIEDRMVKKIFSNWAREVPLMPGYESLAVKPKVKLLTKKPLVPTSNEQEKNPASKSAKLRAIEKI